MVLGGVMRIGIPYKKNEKTIGFKIYDECFEPLKEYYVNIVFDSKISVKLMDKDGNVLSLKVIEE